MMNLLMPIKKECQVKIAEIVSELSKDPAYREFLTGQIEAREKG